MNERRSHHSSNSEKQQIFSSETTNCNQFPIIGINLGISYWSAAIVHDGQNVIIPIFGKSKIPAFISYFNNEFKFGNEAKQMFFDNKEMTIFDIIYILGLRFNSGGELEEHMNDYSYAVSNFGDKPILSFANGKLDVSIEELFDIIIKNLIYSSKIFLNKTIHNIVVPIPMYFKESQKSALLRATTHAGIIELIPEPIAALYAYKIHEKYKDDTTNHYLLIYNLQDDNLDVSVVQYSNNKFKIKSNIYERHLKNNYTYRYLDELCTQTYESYFISNPRFHPLNSGTLRYYCKTIFEDMLDAEYFEIEMDTIIDEKIKRIISRNELNELLKTLVQESLTLIENVLTEANLNKNDIDEVLLVGHITKHPIVRQQLKNFFGKKSLNRSMNPEDVLVIGAAIRASILQNEISSNHIQIENSKPLVPDNLPDISVNSIITSEKLSSKSENINNYNSTKNNAVSCTSKEETDIITENKEKYVTSNVCFEAGDVYKKKAQKSKLKPKLLKKDSVKKKKNKLSVRDKMLSMCALFTDVVSSSNLKMSVKEKLLFVPSYVRNKLRSQSRRLKNDISNDKIKENNQNDFFEINSESEYYRNQDNYIKEQRTSEDIKIKEHNEEDNLKQNDDPFEMNDASKQFICQQSDSMFNDKLKYFAQGASKLKNKQRPFPEHSADFYSIANSEYDLLMPKQTIKGYYQEKKHNSLVDKVNCIKGHMDMYFIIVCLVVFILHWASENVCINIAIALISIALTLILNNRAAAKTNRNN